MAKYKVLKKCMRVSEGNKAYGVGGIMEVKPGEVDKLIAGGYISPEPIKSKKKATIKK